MSFIYITLFVKPKMKFVRSESWLYILNLRFKNVIKVRY